MPRMLLRHPTLRFSLGISAIGALLVGLGGAGCGPSGGGSPGTAGSMGSAGTTGGGGTTGAAGASGSAGSEITRAPRLVRQAS